MGVEDGSNEAERRPRVLVVEDDIDVRLLIHAALGDICWVLVARTLKEGVLLAKREHPDLLLFDRALADFDERSLLDRLGTDPKTASTPVIVLVAADQSVSRRVHPHVKPVDPAELAAQVVHVLGLAPEVATGSSVERISKLETRPGYSVSCDTDADTLASSSGLTSTAVRGQKTSGEPTPPSLTLGDEVAGRYLVRELSLIHI